MTSPNVPLSYSLGVRRSDVARVSRVREVELRHEREKSGNRRIKGDPIRLKERDRLQQLICLGVPIRDDFTLDLRTQGT